MNRRLIGRLAAGCASLAACLPLVGCDYSTPEDQLPVPIRQSRGVGGGQARAGQGAGDRTPSAEDRKKQDTILESVLNLVQTASVKPGGDNFGIAADLLNEYFEQNTAGEDYAMSAPARQFLATQMSEEFLKSALEGRKFAMRDARHIEDCMMYHKIAARVGGVGDDLERVRRVFEWIVEQVTLVPAGSLAPPGLPQAQVRPYDVLMRGMGTEADGFWSERGWLFMVLCRQLGIDVGLLSYAPRSGQGDIPWICGAVIDGKLYLFDQRLGLPIPGPGGQGVATLDEALSDPSILDRLGLPGQHPNVTTRAELLASPTKIGVLIDSSRGGLAPRMRLLQQRLTGKDRTILYRDPAEQRANFARAMGDRLGAVSLWQMPLTVEELLFTDPNFVRSTAESMRLLDPVLPLLYARHAQLRGDLDEAKLKFVDLRKNADLTLTDGKTPVPPEVRQALDVYATHFLALCHLETGNTSDARFFLKDSLATLPNPGPKRPYYLMFRWAAATNLARLNRAEGDLRSAAGHFAMPNPTSQGVGNLVAATDLVWADPTGEPPDALPEAPAFRETPSAIAAPAPGQAPAEASRPILPGLGQLPAGLDRSAPAASAILPQAPGGGNP